MCVSVCVCMNEDKYACIISYMYTQVRETHIGLPSSRRTF